MWKRMLWMFIFINANYWWGVTYQKMLRKTYFQETLYLYKEWFRLLTLFFCLSLSLTHTPPLLSLPLNLPIFSSHLWNEDRYCGDVPVSPIENLFAALMKASQKCDCLSTFFMVRCQMDVSRLMKIICVQFPVPHCSRYRVCVCFWILVLASHLHWYSCITA